MPKPTLFFVFVPLLLALPLSGTAGPPKHSRSKGVTAQEARAAASKRHEAAVKLNSMKSKMHNVKVKINHAEAKAGQITETISEVKGRIERAQSKLAKTQSRIQSLEERHDNTVDEIETTTQRLKERRRLLTLRVRENYERGQITYAQVLLQSRSVQDFMSRGYYVRHIVASDAKLIDGVREDLKRVERQKRTLEAQQREQQELAGQYEAQKEELLRDKARQQELLKTTLEAKSQAKEELDDIEGEADAMTERIRQLSSVIRRRREAEARERAALRHAQREALIRAREAARRRAEAQRPPRPGKKRRIAAPPRLHEEALPEEPLPSQGTGSFMRPVTGPITSNFGYRYHPILHRRRLHAGTDFGVHTGTPIHAADSGIVILSGHSGGYGNCIIIDHGHGLTTLYGHCSRLVVSEGQSVHKGDLIAFSGSTGLSTGPHLHWEVRRNGTPVHP